MASNGLREAISLFHFLKLKMTLAFQGLVLQVCLTMSFQKCLKHKDGPATSAAVTLRQDG